jgi:hypothetical protein
MQAPRTRASLSAHSLLLPALLLLPPRPLHLLP